MKIYLIITKGVVILSGVFMDFCLKLKKNFYALSLSLFIMVGGFYIFAPESTLAKNCGPDGARCSCEECLSNCSEPDEAQDPINCLLNACPDSCQSSDIISKAQEMFKDDKDKMSEFIVRFYKQCQHDYSKEECDITLQDSMENFNDNHSQLDLKFCIETPPIAGGFGCSERERGANDGSCPEINVQDFFNKFVVAFQYIVGGLAVLKIILGGYLYATSAGNPKQTADGKSHILYALIGIALVAFTWVILTLFGIPDIKPPKTAKPCTTIESLWQKRT